MKRRKQLFSLWEFSDTSPVFFKPFIIYIIFLIFIVRLTIIIFFSFVRSFWNTLYIYTYIFLLVDIHTAIITICTRALANNVHSISETHHDSTYIIIVQLPVKISPRKIRLVFSEISDFLIRVLNDVLGRLVRCLKWLYTSTFSSEYSIRPTVKLDESFN